MSRDSDQITRREALRKLGATSAAGLLTACQKKKKRAVSNPTKPSSGQRMPAVYLPHGGGPWPFVESMFGSPDMMQKLDKYLRSLNLTLPRTAESVLVVSAHWEAPVPTVMTAKKPPMLYDYYGFPPQAYEVEWPAPGQPELAAKVRDLLERAGIQSAADAQRGFDHGTFVITKLAYPQADVPTIQLSLKQGLDPAEHLEMGRALAPLRDAGVFIIGSGMSYHNMRGFRDAIRGVGAGAVRDSSRAFDDWLAESVTLDPSRRQTRLVEWERAPQARACHPREEHLLPLMMVAGAAGDDAGSVPYRDRIMGAHVSATHFG